MQSKTSFFNKTLFRKNLTRYAVLWGGYLLGLLMLQMLALFSGIRSDRAYSYYSTFIDTASLLSAGYAFLTSQALFGDLYNTRLCYGLHSMPVRREGLYLANIASGLLFNLIPTTVAALAAALMLRSSYITGAPMLAFYWWAIVNLFYLFCFGVGACCAMLAGNRLGQAALYGIVNLGSILLYVLVSQVYTPMLYGVITIVDPFLTFSPVVWAMDGSVTRFVYMNTWEIRDGQEWVDAGELVLEGGWEHLLVVAAVGIVMLAVGVLLYRRRKLEAAGDFLAVKGLEPVALVALSLAVGIVTAYIGNLYLTKEYIRIPFLFIGTVVGWFAGKMLLERTTRVFRRRNWVGIGALCGVLLLSLGLTKLDVLGLSSRIPELSEIDHITLDGNLVAEEDEETVLLLHAQAQEDRLTADMFSEDEEYYAEALSDLNNNYSYFCYRELDSGEYAETVRITYTLKNGRRLSRRYCMLSSSEAGQTLRKLTSTISYIFNDSKTERMINDEDVENQIVTLEDLLEEIQTPKEISISAADDVAEELLTKENVEMLLAAYAQDIQDGNASESAAHAKVKFSNGEEVDEYINIYIQFVDSDDFYNTKEYYEWEGLTYVYFCVYPDCTNTIAALEKLGVSWDSIVERWEKSYSGIYY